jgi:hypothetical protein
MKIVFTICSNNYLAQAKTLGDTLIKHNPDYLFIIGLCDRKNSQIDYSVFSNYQIIEVENIGIENFPDMVSRYTVIELNTSSKPFFFDYLLGKYENAETILYLDPDIAIFDKLTVIEDKFKNNSILLTPHIYTPIEIDGKLPSENIFTNNGIYNLGFIGLKRNQDTLNLLSWWKNRLTINCYDKTGEGIFVDQLPMNFAPLFFKNVHIFRNFGLNMAPWNLHERKLTNDGRNYLVNGRYPLIFYHFSNYNPLFPEKLSTNYDRISFADNLALKEIYDLYKKCLLENNFEKYRKVDCYFGTNGIYREQEITKFIKRLDSTREELSLIQTELSSTKTELDSTKTELGKTSRELDMTQTELGTTRRELDSTQTELRITQNELYATKAELANVYASRTWKAVSVLRGVVIVLIPEGSLRRKTAIFAVKMIKPFLLILLKLLRKIKSSAPPERKEV